MKTLDITKTHDGIVVLTGFGGKHWETGYYLNGKLYAEGRDGLEDAEALAKLCKKLAKDAGYSWNQRLTHIWWRLSSYSDIPRTLSAYDAKTVKAYQSHSDVVLESQEPWIPRREYDEKNMVSEAYELSGGAEIEFDRWYDAYLKEVGSFNARHDDLLARFGRIDVESSREQYLSAQNELIDLMRAYLAEVHRATKPLDPVAKRALREMRSGS